MLPLVEQRWGATGSHSERCRHSPQHRLVGRLAGDHWHVKHCQGEMESLAHTIAQIGEPDRRAVNPRCQTAGRSIQLTVTVPAGPPGARVPSLGEASSHDAVLTRVQLKADVPTLVNE